MRRLVLTITAVAALSLGSISAMPDPDWNVIDPPVLLTSAADKPLLIKWQTSVPGAKASPIEQQALAAGQHVEFLKHANVWVVPKSSTGKTRNVANTIEVWVYDPADPKKLLANYKTVRDLFPESVAQKDKKIVLEIDISKYLGIEVKLDKFR